jgi:hypothetical protein
MSNRRKEPPPFDTELHIDLNDERVLEAVANLLLDLTRHHFEPAEDESESR